MDSEQQKHTDAQVVAQVVAALDADDPIVLDLVDDLADVAETVLEKNSEELSEALLWADPPTAMRVLNSLPSSFTRRHADSYVAYLTADADPGYAAAAFVAFKARSERRSAVTERNLDKALWKWLRQADRGQVEDVLRTLGPEWGELWVEYVACVHGAGRLSRRLHRLQRKLLEANRAS